MSDTTVAFSPEHWNELIDALREPRETAAVLLAGTADTAAGLVLTVNRILWIPDSAYETRTSRQLQIQSHGWMPYLRTAADGEWLPIFLHTHPGIAATPSARDEVVGRQLSRAFRTRVGRDHYVSLIFGGQPDRPTFTGRIFEQDAASEPVTRLRVAGQRLRIQNAEDNDAPAPPVDIFDRQVRAFGNEGQQLLHNLRVGVVGCGGTGSAVLEQLTRLGVGALTFIDYDTVTDTNITRIYGSTRDDVGRPKVDVLHDHLASIGPGTLLRPVNGDITRRDIMERLRDCDVIFAGTDDDGGRGIPSRLAYWYLIPVIDMGVVIASTHGEVAGVYGRITTATPGDPCLLCRGEFDPIRAREQQYSDSERHALIEEGYARV
jgi:molybdopterin/thiamine biosynthesis adenylyltransferase